MPVPDREFDLWRPKYTDPGSLIAAVRKAEQIVSNKDLSQLMMLDSGSLVEARSSFVSLLRYLDHVQKDLDLQTKQLTADGDPDLLSTSLRDTLAKLSALDAPS